MAAHVEDDDVLRTPGAFDHETLESILDGLLRHDPPPLALSIDENGLIVPMPAAVPLSPASVLGLQGSALALTSPPDLAKVVEAWERARRTGMARTVIRLRSEPERPVTLHLVDARYRYGVYLGLIEGSAAGVRATDPQPSLFRPRLCSMRRDMFGVILEVDAASTKILGWSSDELVGKRTLELLHVEDQPAAIASWVEMLGRPGGQQRGLFRYRHRDGGYIWMEATNENRLADKAVGNVVTQLLDVSERMEAIEALRASERLLRRLTEALPIGIVQIDADRRIVHTNERVSTILGIADAATIDDELRCVTAAERDLLGSTLRATLTLGIAADIELTLDHPRGQRRCSVGLRALTNEQAAVTGAIACITDITESVLMREELQERATFDDLTRCHNRPAILERLASLLRAPERSHAGTAVLFIDLDRFKEVNDDFGHAAGDELLRRVGERLLHGVRAGDLVGRLGGDEFLVVCPNVGTPALALDMARRIAGYIAQDTLLGSRSIVPVASIGVAWTASPMDPEALVARADSAMYDSKQRGTEPVLYAVAGST